MQDVSLEEKKLATGSTSEIAHTPVVTYMLLGLCVLIFIFLNYGKDYPAYNDVVQILMPSAIEIWEGYYHALLTSVFVHYAFFHILFNMWWTKDFGKMMEPKLGKFKFIIFVLFAAFISSGTQLATSDQTGIGFSGVVYAMFGYCLAARFAEPAYQQIVNKETIKWLLGWLILCIILSILDIWNVANAAHIGGVLFGYFIGNIFTAKKENHIFSNRNNSTFSFFLQFNVLYALVRGLEKQEFDKSIFKS